MLGWTLKGSACPFRVKILLFTSCALSHWPCVSVYVKSRLKKKTPGTSFQDFWITSGWVCLLKRAWYGMVKNRMTLLFWLWGHFFLVSGQRLFPIRWDWRKHRACVSLRVFWDVCLSMRSFPFAKFYFIHWRTSHRVLRAYLSNTVVQRRILCWEKIAALLSQLYKTQCSRWMPASSFRAEAIPRFRVTAKPCLRGSLYHGSPDLGVLLDIYLYIYLCI